MKLNPLLALALAAVLPALPACGGDDGGGRPGPDPITWRVPCGATAHTNDGPSDTMAYVNDAGKHQIESTSFDNDGVVWAHTTRGFTGDLLAWTDVVIGTSTTYTYAITYDDQDREILQVRTDRNLANGDNGFTTAFAYDADGAQISADIDFANPEIPNIHSTITGDLTTRQTSVDCTVGTSPAICDTYVFDQADRNPYHWTLGTADLGSDGVVDYRWTRTLDANDRELTYVETDFAAVPAGVVSYRFTTTREADGTAVRTANDFLDLETGAVTDTYTVENRFTCPAARTTGTPTARSARGIDRGAAHAHLPVWRADRR